MPEAKLRKDNWHVVTIVSLFFKYFLKIIFLIVIQIKYKILTHGIIIIIYIFLYIKNYSTKRDTMVTTCKRSLRSFALGMIPFSFSCISLSKKSYNSKNIPMNVEFIGMLHFILLWLVIIIANNQASCILFWYPVIFKKPFYC